MRRKIFVTGAAGFIGSHVVDTLLEEGEMVTAYDNLTSGRLKWIEPHIGNPRFRFIKGDILSLKELVEHMAGHDTVWHLAANTDIAKGEANTDLDLNLCIVGTRHVLEAMRLSGARRLLFASSQVVYGAMDEIPRSETFGPLLPISLYAAGKLAGEALISAFSHLFNIQACIYRYANVVGGRMSHGVTYDFIQKLRQNPRKLKILGDGNQEKNFYLVEDCIEGMRFASDRSTAKCDIFNLGGTGRITVRRIAEIVIEEMGLSDVSIQYLGAINGWKGDQAFASISTEKINKLGWKARHNAEEAVRIAVRRLIHQ